MTLNSNQFALQNVKGEIVKIGNQQTLPVVIASTETATITAAEAVKIVNTAGPSIPVENLAAATDDIFGFVPFLSRQNEHVANDRLEIATMGSGVIMIMEAGAAIARGASVEYQITDKKVITSAGTNNIVGHCLDVAAADGDLVRVILDVQRDNQV